MPNLRIDRRPLTVSGRGGVRLRIAAGHPLARGPDPRRELAVYQESTRSRHQFLDTANRYSLSGNSEEILGRAIKDFARRDGVVIATKVYGRMRTGPNGAGSRGRLSSTRSTTGAPYPGLQFRPVDLAAAEQGITCRSSAHPLTGSRRAGWLRWRLYCETNGLARFRIAPGAGAR